MDSTQDVWAGLHDELKSYLFKSVASITLCNGDFIFLYAASILSFSTNIY